MNRYIVTAPATPGATPTSQPAPTLAQARKIARDISRGRHWMRGQDVRIERLDGTLVEYAGVGA